MGTTGLETAFAALYTELVLPGELELETIVRADDRRRALYGLPTPRIAAARRPTSALSTSTRAGRSARAGTRADRRTAASTGARSTAACVLTVAAGAIAYRAPMLAERGDAQQPMSPTATAYVLLEDGARFDGLACGADRPRGGRDRVHDLDVRLPGGDDRPQLRGPADRLHVPADRQLRRQRRGDGVRPRPRARGDHARRSRPRRRPGRGAGLADDG